MTEGAKDGCVAVAAAAMVAAAVLGAGHAGCAGRPPPPPPDADRYGKLRGQADRLAACRDAYMAARAALLPLELRHVGVSRSEWPSGEAALADDLFARRDRARAAYEAGAAAYNREMLSLGRPFTSTALSRPPPPGCDPLPDHFPALPPDY